MLGLVVWNFKGEAGHSCGDGKAKVWQINVCWARQRQRGAKKSFNKWILPGSFLSTHLLQTTVIRGDSAFPGAAPLHSFRQLGGRSKFLSESFGT